MGPYMDPYIMLYCFCMIYTCLLHCVYMFLCGFIRDVRDVWHILKTHLTHILSDSWNLARIMLHVLRPIVVVDYAI